MKQRQYNLDKTAYDLEKKKTEDLFGRILYLCASFYFFAQILRRFILCVELLDLLETYRHLEF